MYTSNSSVESQLRECERTTRESGLTEGCIVINESPELRICAFARVSSSDTSDFTLEIMLNPIKTQDPDSSSRADKLAKLARDLKSMGYELDHREMMPIVGRLRVHPFTVDAEYKSLAFVVGMFFRSISNEDATMQGRLSCSS